MTTIAHISDLHFGAETPEIVEGLVRDLLATDLTLLVASGDLTQRARRKEFIAARAFLDRMPCARLVVPGNHDIPFYDVFNRFFRPLVRFRRYIDERVDPFIRIEDLAVLGLNTARSNTWKNGRVARAQVDEIPKHLSPIPPEALKVIVTHHPFLPPPGDTSPPLVGRAREALQAAEKAGVDLMLAGHLHHGYTGDIRAHHEHVRRPILVAQAGTATSHRVRNEPNSYNVIRRDKNRLLFSLRRWDGARFEEVSVTSYVKQGVEWLRDAAS